MKIGVLRDDREIPLNGKFPDGLIISPLQIEVADMGGVWEEIRESRC